MTKNKKENKKKVFVAISGGVDSSVSAALLKEKGYDVTGVFIKVWHPDFLPCTWRNEMLDAMRVCAHLDIPFLTFDFENEYKKNVVDYMIDEYKAGRTPNPDVMCNKHIKFGVFLERAKKMGADYMATGHYARVSYDLNSEVYRFYKGIDSDKDQSYFLWSLNQDQLSRTLFPIGDLKKREVRTLAKKFNLSTAEKKDSQGLCFIGKLNMKKFLKEFIKEKKGDVLDEDGNVIGEHEGAFFYTIGQRHGFTVKQHNPRMEPYYIVQKNMKKNTVTVSNNLMEKTGKKEVKLENTNWIVSPDESVLYEARSRYRQELKKCNIFDVKNTSAKVIFSDRIPMSPEGQSMVVYSGDECMGGGIIS